MWRRYTNDFILRNGLDAEQRAHALALCARCEEEGTEYVKHARDELERVLQSANRDGPSVDQRKLLSDRRDELIAPLSGIFENKLQPGLEKLLTRAQRARAQPESSPSSAPAAPK